MNNYSEILNDKWAIDFKYEDDIYKDFYKENIYYTNLYTIYINRNSEIDVILKENYILSEENKISREEIVGILKKKSIYNNKNYKVVSVLKYNITLDPSKIVDYINNDDYETYLTNIEHIDNITFEKSINKFQDLTDIYILYYEKSTELKSKNKSSTKKIFFRKRRKTKRKVYKD